MTVDPPDPDVATTKEVEPHPDLEIEDGELTEKSGKATVIKSLTAKSALRAKRMSAAVGAAVIGLDNFSAVETTIPVIS